MPWPFTRSKPEVSQATGFDFSLFRELAALAISENVLISPASVRLCLSLLYDGARGETRRGLAQALGFDGLGEDEVRLATVGLKSAQLSSGAGVQLLLQLLSGFRRGSASIRYTSPVPAKYITRRSTNWTSSGRKQCLESTRG